MKPVWVVDTNVVVSGLISPKGAPAQVLEALAVGRFVPAFDAAILSEWQSVLNRSRFGFPEDDLVRFFAAVNRFGRFVFTPSLVRGVLGLPDPTDQAFLAVALSTPDRILVTGNGRHFPRRFRRGVEVLTPREAVARLA